MEHYAVNITDEQRANLAQLADYLATGETEHRFDMRVFFRETECGTVACAVGRGPSAGIPRREGEDWVEYADRVFGDGYAAFKWCFSADWSDTDNTPQGAAARIRYMLERGLPKNWFDQLFGTAPLSYGRAS